MDIENAVENELIDIEVMEDTETNAESKDESNIIIENSNQQKQKLLRLPLSRIKTIMKMDPQVEVVSQEAAFLVTKATENFLEYLVKEAERYLSSVKRKTMMKRDIESAIDSSSVLCFLDGALE